MPVIENARSTEIDSNKVPFQINKYDIQEYQTQRVDGLSFQQFCENKIQATMQDWQSMLQDYEPNINLSQFYDTVKKQSKILDKQWEDQCKKFGYMADVFERLNEGMLDIHERSSSDKIASTIADLKNKFSSIPSETKQELENFYKGKSQASSMQAFLASLIKDKKFDPDAPNFLQNFQEKKPAIFLAANDIVLDGVDFTNVDLSEISFQNSVLHDVTFNNEVQGADFKNTQIIKAKGSLEMINSGAGFCHIHDSDLSLTINKSDADYLRVSGNRGKVSMVDSSCNGAGFDDVGDLSLNKVAIHDGFIGKVNTLELNDVRVNNGSDFKSLEIQDSSNGEQLVIHDDKDKLSFDARELKTCQSGKYEDKPVQDNDLKNRIVDSLMAATRKKREIFTAAGVAGIAFGGLATIALSALSIPLAAPIGMVVMAAAPILGSIAGFVASSSKNKLFKNPTLKRLAGLVCGVGLGALVPALGFTLPVMTCAAMGGLAFAARPELLTLPNKLSDGFIRDKLAESITIAPKTEDSTIDLKKIISLGIPADKILKIVEGSLRQVVKNDQIIGQANQEVKNQLKEIQGMIDKGSQVPVSKFFPWIKFKQHITPEIASAVKLDLENQQKFKSDKEHAAYQEMFKKDLALPEKSLQSVDLPKGVLNQAAEMLAVVGRWFSGNSNKDIIVPDKRVNVDKGMSK